MQAGLRFLFSSVDIASGEVVVSVLFSANSHSVFIEIDESVWRFVGFKKGSDGACHR